MPIFFTSDHHFGHAAARTFYRRPFASVEEMDQRMIDRWNSIVGDDDDVWHLGDFAVGASPERAAFLLRSLRGRKHLVVGNNDDAVIAKCTVWCSVQAYAELTLDGILVVICHYPFRTWRGMNKGAINLHGHSHGRLKPLLRQFDVGVDARDFTPVTLQTLLLDRRRRVAR
ncbi:MAG TPA: metallophosphoesterase [Acetobacteraceae bacterium]|nr:metallophosphoesterase [Acetobacteraceae bacterium]